MLFRVEDSGQGMRMKSRHQANILVVMGVSGVGKTVVAEALAHKLHCCFQEGDALHSKSNVAKMSSGQPLTDCDRKPWLQTIAEWITKQSLSGQCGIITCSALKRSYRKVIIGQHENVRVVYLKCTEAVIEARLKMRKHHFMPAGLLKSQLDTLEEPVGEENPITVDASKSIEEVISEILSSVGFQEEQLP